MRVEHVKRMAIRIDHDAMQGGAELSINGPAATDAAAASGDRTAHAPIPGEHDHTSEAQTQPAIVGTTGYGADVPETSVDPTLDEETRKQSRWEGGGRVSPGDAPEKKRSRSE